MKLDTTTAHVAARYASCTAHLGSAMRFLMLSKDAPYILKAVRFATPTNTHRCRCGKNATYYFQLIGTE